MGFGINAHLSLSRSFSLSVVKLGSSQCIGDRPTPAHPPLSGPFSNPDMVNVRIISEDTVKPSSPTPDSLRFLQLSMLDQVPGPENYISLILFFSDNDTAGKSSQLKSSLSKVLTIFYPLAGRIKYSDDDALDVYGFVECNDEGVQFYEVQANVTLSEFLQTDDPDPLLPCMVSLDIPLAVQVNLFDCGGLAIGFKLSHTVADGASMFMFIKSWADLSRGGLHSEVVDPTFGFASLLPPRRSMKNQLKHKQVSLPLEEKQAVVVGKRLIFVAAKISLLREKFAAASRPTRVEAVLALIWRCMIRSRGEAWRDMTPVAAVGVNIRERMEPQLPTYSFGNLVVVAYATCSGVVTNEDGIGYVEGQLREAIGKMKGDHLKQVLQDDEEMNLWRFFVERGKGGIDLYMFSCWVGFPLYESDFGWGRPERFSLFRIQSENAVHLTSARDGEGGIEALVFLEEEQMAKFEQDPELLAIFS